MTIDDRASTGRWWYVVAAVPVVGALGLALLAVRLGFGSLGPVDRLVGPYVSLLAAALLANPIALYLDARSLRRAGAAWQPDPVVYVALAVLGISLPPLSPIVSLVYLSGRFGWRP